MTTMFFIMAVAVYCLDVGGFPEWFRGQFKWGDTPLSDERFDKPFFCSRCITFWAGVLLAVAHMDVEIFLWGCLFSWLVPVFQMLATAVQDVFAHLYESIKNLLNR